MKKSNPASIDSNRKHSVPAVVVGLCAHGLAIVRELYSAGIPVIALETNRNLSGVRTHCAEILFVEEINSDGLIEIIINLAQNRNFSVKPVLFLTNDRMVETVGGNVHKIAGYYRLSWASTACVVLSLLDKKNIEHRCIETGLKYPVSIILEGSLSLAEQTRKLTFPIILKPTRPLSAFKTLVFESSESLFNKAELIASSMPVLAQEFIPGDDSCIFFCALLLQDGKVLAHFEGQKLRSRQMRHSTVAIPAPNDEVYRLTKQFFDGKRLSGPVSFE